MTHIQWDGSNMNDVFHLWIKAPKTHAVATDKGRLRIRKNDTKPFDISSAEFPSLGSFLWLKEDGSIDWAPWAQ